MYIYIYIYAFTTCRDMLLSLICSHVFIVYVLCIGLCIYYAYGPQVLKSNKPDRSPGTHFGVAVAPIPPIGDPFHPICARLGACQDCIVASPMW